MKNRTIDWNMLIGIILFSVAFGASMHSVYFSNKYSDDIDALEKWQQFEKEIK